MLRGLCLHNVLLLAIDGVDHGGIGHCVLSTWRKIETKHIPPLALAEGVCSAATLTLFNYTYYHFFMMHGTQYLFDSYRLIKFCIVHCNIVKRVYQIILA